jgi:hypothetical protein
MRTQILLVCVALGACSSLGGTPPGRKVKRLVVTGLFDIDVNGPVRKLTTKAPSGRVGGYQVGKCVLRYDSGINQGGLEPSTLDFPDDYVYRAKPIGEVPARWATWTKEDDPPMKGPYWAGLYVYSLMIRFACETEDERAEAVTMLESVKLTGDRQVDLAKVDPSRGPPEWGPAPELCTQTHDAAAEGEGEATVHVKSEDSSSQLTVALQTEQDVHSRAGKGTVEIKAPAGKYTLEVYDQASNVRCHNIELIAGRVTVVKVRFKL